jgi:membrane protein required for colicin V production
VRQVLAFFVLFVAAFLAGTVAAVLVNKFVLKQEAVRVPNMLLGGVLGAARGGFILVILFMLAGLTAVPRASWWQESLLAPYVQRAAVFASAYIPRDVARHIRYG